jgi:demethylmenaquinone methyltransferase/2-methoxy-6-polyprenyl-1,4-benzoquinol methylase
MLSLSKHEAASPAAAAGLSSAAMQKGEEKSAATQASFGARPVTEDERQGLVNEVFSQVARHYDQMNDLMSGGLHRLWKDDLVARLNPPKSARPFRAIDVAGGTGDIALRILKAGGQGCEVVIADISPAMVAEGRKRAGAAALGHRCRFTVANAEALPFPGRSFDAYTVAFGIRNVTHIDRALGEAFRVLKPGGRFLCLEFSAVDVPGLDRLYEAYSSTVIPAMGKIVTGDGAPYRYLAESIRAFPNQASFAAMIAQAGFERTTYQSLMGGIVAIHSAWRL